MNYNSVIRIRIITIAVIISIIIVLSRVYFIQIVKGDEYSGKANRQYSKSVVSVFNRGSIFFSSKDNTKIAAATIKDGYTLSINPKNISDPNLVYEALQQYIDLDKNIFLEKASKKDDSYEEIVRKLDRATGQSINSLKINGINIQRENWRVYLGNSLAIHTVGITGLDKDNNLAGRYGLERYYEKVLSRNNNNSSLNFFAELFSGIKATVFDDKNKEGDIVSSIELTAESFLEKILFETKEKWNSDSIGGIIMNPKNGEIIAMASLPNFNPNDLSNIKNPIVFSNPLIENIYEMGSIIKPLTMAIGIDSDVITAKSTYNDTGFLNLNSRKISNFDGRPRGITPMQEVLSQSLNVGAATIALKVGADDFLKYLLDLGFGEITNIDQPNEQKGIIKNLLDKKDVEIATASYGQGIAMTPIQTIRALAVLANDGILITPHLVKSIEYTDGETEEITNLNTRRIFKKATVDEVTNMLVNVVDEALKKGELKMENYSIAAKTGTAQIADPVNGGYYTDRYLHSFFGYFPAYNPKFIVFLYHVYPKDVEYASETLAIPFIELTKLLINYYEVPPDR